MPWCPKCKIEYRVNYTKCSECGSALVPDKLKKLQETNSIVQSEPCILSSGLSQLDATMFGALLEDAGIPFFVKDHGMGGYMRLYMGYTVYGQDIYVDKTCYLEAKELLDFYNNIYTEPLEPEQDNIVNDVDHQKISETEAKSHYFKKSTAALIIIILIILTRLLVYILNHLT